MPDDDFTPAESPTAMLVRRLTELEARVRKLERLLENLTEWVERLANAEVDAR